MRLPYGMVINFEDLWTPESQLKTWWYGAIRKNEQKDKCFILKLNGRFAYANEKLEFTPNINEDALALSKKLTNDSYRQLKWANRISLLASYWTNMAKTMNSLTPEEFEEEKEKLRKYIPDAIINNQNFFSELLKNINTMDYPNYSWFKPIKPRPAILFYLADKDKLCIHTAYAQYKNSPYPNRGDYDDLPEELKELYEEIYRLDKIRYHAELLKCSNAQYLNYLTEVISLGDVFKCPLANGLGENTRMRKKVSVFMQIKIENWISALMKKMEELFRKARWGNRKNSVLKLAVNECLTKFPKDPESPIVHYTMCGENLNENKPVLYIIEQSIFHQESWLEANENTEEPANFLSDPLFLPYMCVNLGHGIKAKLYEIEDALFDIGR
ncbi:unnamed protein product [Blepharisma stoltei]|uniref:Uncharacterized protein n=1 Tax=Blepharisma stoltei TaxID=1481888 RepID=A0AAU9J552_9CILI|nr:unnamed protein product [Blepharisma stoltei]